jgi:hypothetical protein
LELGFGVLGLELRVWVLGFWCRVHTVDYEGFVHLDSEVNVDHLVNKFAPQNALKLIA